MPAVIDTDRLLAEVASSTDTLADISDSADPAAQVPTCPDWTLRQLITHVGRAQRWATAIVATRSAEPIPFREVPDGRLPDDPAERSGWLRLGAAGLAEAVQGAGTSQAWTHHGMGPASYWARRMAHETAVHRADGQLTVGTRPVIDPVIAVDGIDEWLGLLPYRPGAQPPTGTSETLHLHCTDRDGEWLIRLTEAAPEIERTHGKGDVAVRGPASDVLLVLLRRLDPDQVEVFGDRTVLDHFLTHAAF